MYLSELVLLFVSLESGAVQLLLAFQVVWVRKVVVVVQLHWRLKPLILNNNSFNDSFFGLRLFCPNI